MKREPRIEFVDMPEEIRAAYQYSTLSDIGRLRASGYENEVSSLTSAVRDYVNGYLMPAGPEDF